MITTAIILPDVYLGVEIYSDSGGVTKLANFVNTMICVNGAHLGVGGCYFEADGTIEGYPYSDMGPDIGQLAEMCHVDIQDRIAMNELIAAIHKAALPVYRGAAAELLVAHAPLPGQRAYEWWLSGEGNINHSAILATHFCDLVWVKGKWVWDYRLAPLVDGEDLAELILGYGGLDDEPDNGHRVIERQWDDDAGWVVVDQFLTWDGEGWSDREDAEVTVLSDGIKKAAGLIDKWGDEVEDVEIDDEVRELLADAMREDVPGGKK